MTDEQCRVEVRAGRFFPDIPNNVLDQFKMTGKVCLITGASRGIGAAVSEGLAEAGAHLVLVYSSNNPGMAQTAKELSQRHGVKVSNL